MWETICNKNTVQDEYGKQRSQQERQDTRGGRRTRPAGEGGSSPTYTVRLYHIGQVDLIERTPQSRAGIYAPGRKRPPASLVKLTLLRHRKRVQALL